VLLSDLKRRTLSSQVAVSRIYTVWRMDERPVQLLTGKGQCLSVSLSNTLISANAISRRIALIADTRNHKIAAGHYKCVETLECRV
jgi:hypothetical protein